MLVQYSELEANAKVNGSDQNLHSHGSQNRQTNFDTVSTISLASMNMSCK